ncbi:MAG: hypothetical protein LBP23_08140 [Treponema sp.]|nr:hypothetical protein [Treponema sp.]
MCLCLLLSGPLSAQTAALLDAVLESKQVTFSQAAEIILPAAGLLDPDAGPEAAFEGAREWFPRRASRDDPITMGELSHLVMKSFGLSGGFLYALFPGPRYACRALAWRRFLPLRADPYRTVTGGELLYITGRVLSLAGEPDFSLSPEAVPPGMDADQGTGLSGGPEGVMPYRGEFEIE